MVILSVCADIIGVVARQASSSAKTFVVSDEDCIAGYYSLTVGQVDTMDAPERTRQGMGQYPIPVAILARLAVSLIHLNDSHRTPCSTAAFCKVCMSVFQPANTLLWLVKIPHAPTGTLPRHRR